MPSIYGPLGGNTLTFKVGKKTDWVEDPETGNYVPGPGSTATLTYEVSVNLSPASTNNDPGTERVQYFVQGRLLSPHTFDARVTPGSVAIARIHGVTGRFTLQDVGISTEPSYRPIVRQSFSGSFDVVGVGSEEN